MIATSTRPNNRHREQSWQSEHTYLGVTIHFDVKGHLGSSVAAWQALDDGNSDGGKYQRQQDLRQRQYPVPPGEKDSLEEHGLKLLVKQLKSSVLRNIMNN